MKKFLDVSSLAFLVAFFVACFSAIPANAQLETVPIVTVTCPSTGPAIAACVGTIVVVGIVANEFFSKNPFGPNGFLVTLVTDPRELVKCGFGGCRPDEPSCPATMISLPFNVSSADGGNKTVLYTKFGPLSVPCGDYSQGDFGDPTVTVGQFGNGISAVQLSFSYLYGRYPRDFQFFAAFVDKSGAQKAFVELLAAELGPKKFTMPCLDEFKQSIAFKIIGDIPAILGDSDHVDLFISPLRQANGKELGSC